MKKFFYSLIFTLYLLPAISQLNIYERGYKSVYWGISLGLNVSDFSVDRQPISALNDTIRNISSRPSPGFNLGIIGNYQFNQHFDVRFIPSMSFTYPILEYQNQESFSDNKFNSTMISLPLMVRFKSEPVGDWRLFVIGGLRYDYNINNQFRPKYDQQFIPLRKDCLSMEYGIGLQYFFPYFIFSPELKFSHSFFNMLAPNQSEFNRSAIQGLYPRSLTLSINFEG